MLSEEYLLVPTVELGVKVQGHHMSTYTCHLVLDLLPGWREVIVPLVHITSSVRTFPETTIIPEIQGLVDMEIGDLSIQHKTNKQNKF